MNDAFLREMAACHDDLAAFVREDDQDRSLTVVREVGDPDLEGQARRWVRSLRKADADIDVCGAMQIIVDRHADGSREEQRAGIVAAIRFDERGHDGLAAALDALWSVRAKDPRDFWRMVESARRVVLRVPTPPREKGCSCPGSAEKLDKPPRAVKEDPPAEEPHEESNAEPGEDSPQEESDDDDDDDPDLEARKRQRAVEQLAYSIELRQDAERIVAARHREPLTMLGFKDFLASPPLEYLVPGFLYRTSTAKIYGPPGGTKSFLLLDLALSLATGRTWHGRTLPRTRVHYVMAEGQAVNALRAQGWLTHHGVDADELDGWFTAIPQGVLLTPEGVAQYLGMAKLDLPGLVILDTKNRMMVGEENSASDVAVMVRAMDAIKETCEACVALVDHTGLLDRTRGRGSNAVEAAMDTEVRVSRDETGLATAEVTRDKGGVAGLKVSYRLIKVPDVPTPAGISPPAVCDPARPVELPIDEKAAEAYRTWADPIMWELPTDVLALTTHGNGKSAVSDVARYMRFMAHDERSTGRSRAEMAKDVMKTGKYRDDKVLRDAWGRLVGAGRIISKTKSKTAASDWESRPSDPKPREAN